MKKIMFSNKKGESLSAILELPFDQEPQSYAIFAHCFTCNKSLPAIRHFSKQMTANGIAVLRFDFSGLGDSEGNFSDTNFSSNIKDIVAAADFLTANYEAPRVMVGHSLGGAAAIFAASEIASIEAVATIGAPSDPSHVKHLFKDSMCAFEKGSELSKATIGGREFFIKKQLIDDLGQKNMQSVLNKLNKPILILHSPQDAIVEIKNATEIFSYAHHPKSFISLDGADHLMLKESDAGYAGNLVANWAKRYLSIVKKDRLTTDHSVAVRLEEGQVFTSEVVVGNHHFLADEPLHYGGNNFGPSPYEFLLSSLGACTVMTIGMYARRKKLDLGNITVHMTHKKDYTEEHTEEKVDIINKYVEVSKDVSEEVYKKILEIATKCPVHKTLNGTVVSQTEIKRN